MLRCAWPAESGGQSFSSRQRVEFGEHGIGTRESGQDETIDIAAQNRWSTTHPERSGESHVIGYVENMNRVVGSLGTDRIDDSRTHGAVLRCEHNPDRGTIDEFRWDHFISSVMDVSCACTMTGGSINGDDTNPTPQTHEKHVHLATHTDSGDGSERCEGSNHQAQHPPDSARSHGKSNRRCAEERNTHRGREARRTGILKFRRRSKPRLDHYLEEPQHWTIGAGRSQKLAPPIARRT
jgi:hypothetical protein